MRNRRGTAVCAHALFYEPLVRLAAQKLRCSPSRFAEIVLVRVVVLVIDLPTRLTRSIATTTTRTSRNAPRDCSQYRVGGPGSSTNTLHCFSGSAKLRRS